MANFNTLIKRKQYIWLGLILAGGAAAVGGGTAAPVCGG